MSIKARIEKLEGYQDSDVRIRVIDVDVDTPLSERERRERENPGTIYIWACES